MKDDEIKKVREFLMQYRIAMWSSLSPNAFVAEIQRLLDMTHEEKIEFLAKAGIFIDESPDDT